MAGGQAITASTGSVGLSVTVALVGIAIAASQGVVSANNEGFVALSGQSVTVSQQTIEPTLSLALTGIGITSSQGTLTLNLRPTDIVGQAITLSQGTVSAVGDGVTVNLSGVEITSAQGFVQGGVQAISGQAITSAQGTPALDLSVPISGLEITSSQGSVGPSQDADDVFMTISQGTVSPALSLALTGQAITSAQGAVGVTGDVTLELTGQAITSASGTLEYNKQEPLTGLQITSEQYPMGAPGGAALTGIEITVSAGEVFTTSDRTAALTGQAITSAQGLMFASALAFVDGLEITVSAQEIGPRTVTISGLEIISYTGDLSAPVTSNRHAAAAPQKHRRHYLYKGKKYYLSIDELKRLIESDPDVTREDIKVKFKNQKPHIISKQVMAELVDTASIPDTDDQDIEDIIALL